MLLHCVGEGEAKPETEDCIVVEVGQEQLAYSPTLSANLLQPAHRYSLHAKLFR